jgi:serine/threonine protein kinase
MDSDLKMVYDLIAEAICAEDVFGDLIDPAGNSSQMALLERSFTGLSETVNPELYKSFPNDREMAEEARDKLRLFYEKAKDRIEIEVYGQKRNNVMINYGRPAFQTEKRSYYLGEPIIEGDLATVYDGECVMGDEFAGRVAIKIISDPADNDLARNEIRALKLLHSKGGAQRKHLPVLLDHFVTDRDQVGIVLRYLDNCYDFSSVKEKYKKGVPEKHAVWMLNRLLSAIGYAHSLGIVHGNIDPSHLMVRPKDHNLFILDWSYSITDPKHTGEGFKVLNEKFSAPEVGQRKPPLPASDLYSIGLCMIDILGGDVEAKTLPDNVNEELQKFLKFFCLNSPQQRAQDAWQMHGQLETLVVRLWGPKKFLVFNM